jgi:hypothetical protein
VGAEASASTAPVSGSITTAEVGARDTFDGREELALHDMLDAESIVSRRTRLDAS